jgi:hypothetical protein
MPPLLQFATSRLDAIGQLSGADAVIIKTLQQQQAIIARQEARISLLEQRPAVSSLLPGGLNVGLAAGLLPLGLILAVRARRRKP